MRAARASGVLGVTVVAAGLAGCGGDSLLDPDALPAAALERLAGRLTVAAIGAAGGGSGRSIFDNALPCARRGVLGYSDTPDGRRVGFHGCDLGGDVVVDGEGELRWAGPGLEPTRTTFCQVPGSPCPSRLRWTGTLEIALRGDTLVRLDTFEVNDLVMDPAGGAFPGGVGIEIEGRGFASATATVFARSVSVDDPSLPAALFDVSEVAPDALPNPSGAPSALTDADLRRLALQAFMDLAFFLVDETLEAARGDHTHDLPCGQSAVTIDGAMFPHVRNTWTACPGRGVYVSGDFTLEWGALESDRLVMTATGLLTFGGGVPTVSLTRATWTVAAPNLPEGEAEVTLDLEGPGGRRTLTFRVVFDD